nr:MAG TPA: regulatory protein [Caudoviricetes sp.]
MNNLVTLNKNNQPTTSSKVLADTFGKAHKDVIRAINNLEIPADFRERNFAPSRYHSKNKNGQILPAYEITRDGFTLLAMGFTGSKALKFKLQYIQAFNAMEAKLKAIYPCGEVNVREHTRSLPSGKKEIVLSEKAKTEIGGIVKSCMAAAFREELNNFLEGMPKTEDWEVSDSELIFWLHRWHATKNKADTLKFRQLTSENQDLKAKLAKIKQAVA